MSKARTRRNQGPSSKAVLILMLTGALGVGALAWYVKGEPGAAKVPAAIHRRGDSDEVASNHKRHKRVEAAEESDDQDSQTVRMPSIQGDSVTLGKSSVKVPDGTDPKAFLAGDVLKAANVEGVRVLGVDVRNGVAVVNFSDGIDSGMGSSQEGAFLKALQTGFGQFPEVKRVEIDRNGEPVNSLGQIELSDPVPVIRPGQSADQDSKPSAP